MDKKKRNGAVLLGVGVIIAFVDGYLMPPANLFERATIGAAVGSQILPVAAVATLEAPLPRARYWIGIWFLLAIVSDFVQLTLSNLSVPSNLWFINGARVVEDAILLWALSFWQTKPVLRLSFRVGVPFFAGVVVLMAVVAGELTTFQSITGPFRCLVMMSAFSYTLVANLREHSETALARDWLWVSIGFTLYFGTLLIVPPVTASLLPENIALARLVYNIKAIFDVIAFFLVAKGLMCPIPERRSAASLQA